MIGVDPGPLTLRELLWMAEGQGRAAWGHTSALLALIRNAHRDPKTTRPSKPRDFDPYSQRDKESAAIVVEDFGELKNAFESMPRRKR